MIKLSSVIGMYGDIKMKKSDVLELMKYDEDSLIVQMFRITENLLFDRMSKVYDEELKVVITHNEDHILIEDEMQNRTIRIFKNSEDYIIDLTDMLFYYITDTDNTEDVCKDMASCGMSYSVDVLKDYYNSLKEYLPSDYELGNILDVLINK